MADTSPGVGNTEDIMQIIVPELKNMKKKKNKPIMMGISKGQRNQRKQLLMAKTRIIWATE